MLKDKFTLDVLHGPYPHNADGWNAIGYRVRLNYDGRAVCETDYKLGLGHVDLKSPKNRLASLSIGEGRMLAAWIRKPAANFADKDMQTAVAAKLAKVQKVTPRKNDVLYALLADGAAQFDDLTFEDWAAELGYDTDSRKAEAIYRQCCEIGQAFIRTIGRESIQTLRDEFQDY